ncbi:MAG: DNA repair protein RadC [Bacteroidales bacterium]|jgi:DNA repair protein RadC|nr:DNA repair protein RadC [Bacteroidales bacterium]
MEKDKLVIKQWKEDERPREKFISKGSDSLSDAELLSIIIRSGNKEENAVELSRKILRAAGNNLNGLRKFGLEEYGKFKGMGNGKALSIMAAFELYKRMALQEEPEKNIIYSSAFAAQIIAPILKDLNHEECWVLYMNRSNTLLSREKITSGGISATVVDIKMILKSAITKLASSIILVHNHPSGSRIPGEQDKIQTGKLKAAAKICDIDMLDHIIIAGDKYFSFSDEGLM